MTTQPLSARDETATSAGALRVGWPLVAWCALALVLLFGAILALEGTGEDGGRMLVRVSARTSLALFGAAFAASSLAWLWPSTVARFLLVNRRYLGVSFAVSHALHLGAVVWLARVVPDFGIPTPTLVFGGLAYVFLAAMTATSFDVTAAWLGPRRWRRLHLIGGWYLWAIFFLSYLPFGRGTNRSLVPFLAVLAIAALRAAARARRA